jgi:hypothetical protein
MAETNVKILVSAIDQASNVLKNIGNNIEATLGKQAKTNVSGLSSAGAGLTGTLGKLALGAAAMGAAVTVAAVAISRISEAMGGAVNSAVEFERAMIGLQRISVRFGEDADIATQAAQRLSDDGLITVTTAAQGLQTLMTAGLGLDEAVSAMEAYKDQAAFGRSQTLTMDQAVGNLSESFLTESSAIGNLSGQSENYNQILERGASVLGKKVSQLTESERAQAKLIGTLQLGKIVEGDSAAMAELLSGKLSTLDKAKQDLSRTIGQILAPGVQILATLFGNVLTGAINFLQAHMATLQKATIILATTISVLMQAIGGAGIAIAKALTGDWEGAANSAKAAIGGIAISIENAKTKMSEASNGAARTWLDNVSRAAQGGVDKMSEATSKMIKEMEKETEAYQRELEKRKAAQSEQLDDLVRSHIDKKNSLMKDLAEENNDFSTKMRDRTEEFKESMEEMKADHQDKVDSIKEQMAEETEDFNEKISERADNFAEKMADMEVSHESKVANLQRQMDKERVFGDQTNNWKLMDLQASLEEENAEYERQRVKAEEDEAKELEKVRAKNEKKLADLTEQLTKEELAYEESVAKSVARDEKETKRLEEEHAKRTANFQSQIDAENAIMEKHQADFAAVKDKAVEDDITRLKKQHERENAEALAQHERRMKELAEQGAAQGSTFGGAVNAGLIPEIDKSKAALEAGGKEGGEKYAQGVGEGALEAGKRLIENFFSSVSRKISEAANKIGVGPSDIAGLLGGTWAKIGTQLLGFKQAGGVVPGPIGMPVPILAHGGETVSTPGQSKGANSNGSGATFNVYLGLYAGTESEKRNIARDLYASLLQLANSEHKTVQDYMGG